MLDFTVDSVSEAEMRSIINVLSSSLFKCGYFTVIDVSQRDNILKEMEFSLSGCSDESCMLEVGKMLSAEAIVTGSIGKVGSRYVFAAKLMETETAATVSTFDGMYDSLDILMDGLSNVALELAVPYGSSGAIEEAAAGPVKPLNKKIFAWASLAGSAGCLGTGAYFLIVSLPLVLEYLSAQSAYDGETDPATANALYYAAEEARLAVEDANADTNLLVGGSLSVVGAGLGVLSVLLFFPPDTQEEPPVEAVLVPVPGGVLLEFHVRY